MSIRAWFLWLLGGSIVLMISAISLGVLYRVATETRRGQKLKVARQAARPVIATGVYEVVFETSIGKTKASRAVLVTLPQSEQVYLITTFANIGIAKGLPRQIRWNELKTLVKSVRGKPLKASLPELRLTDVLTIPGAQSMVDEGVASLDLIAIKAPSHLKDQALLLRTEALKKDEPLWVLEVWEKEFLTLRPGVVTQVRDEVVKTMFGSDHVSFDSGTPFVDQKGHVIGISVKRNHGPYPTGLLNPSTAIYQKILQADPLGD